MVAVAASGINFSNPKYFRPYTYTAANLICTDSSNVGNTSATVAFFTEMANRGVTDTTNWTSDTYKTILSISSGSGEVYAYIGCTAGGSETHTVRITVDGIAYTMTISGLASGKRACLLQHVEPSTTWTTASDRLEPAGEGLAAGKAIFSDGYGGAYILPWMHISGIPKLEFKRSILIEAKHSASITNSTATAYSAVMYRQFVTS